MIARPYFDAADQRLIHSKLDVFGIEPVQLESRSQLLLLQIRQFERRSYGDRLAGVPGHMTQFTLPEPVEKRIDDKLFNVGARQAGQHTFGQSHTVPLILLKQIGP